MEASADNKNANLKGVGGWLAFLIFTLMIFPLAYAWRILIELGSTVKANPQVAGTDIFSAVSYLMWWAWGMMSACKVAAGISLWKFRTPKAVRVAIIMMWAALLVDLIFMVWISSVMGQTALFVFKAALKEYLTAVSAAVIWTWYLWVSRRVRNTYYALENLNFSSASEKPQQGRKEHTMYKNAIIDVFAFLVFPLIFWQFLYDGLRILDKGTHRGLVVALVTSVIAYVAAFLFSGRYASRGFRQRFSVFSPVFLLTALYWIGLTVLRIADGEGSGNVMVMLFGLGVAGALAWRRIQSIS